MSAFRKKVKAFYRLRGRNLPWRHTRDPYRILVSEIMLQQTRVERVQDFYSNFIKRFPDFVSLTKAKQSDVLRAWQGLGYNRRVLALRKIAEIVVDKYGNKLPRERETLESFPGIGPYTAGAIRTFAFDEPDSFIETNIRRAFIHFFFPRRKRIHDNEILPLVEKTVDRKNPREWYFALMDYGSVLGAGGRAGKNPNHQSVHYIRQSKFLGSDREIRGKILRLILAHKKIRINNLEKTISQPKDRIMKVLDALSREGFLHKRSGTISL